MLFAFIYIKLTSDVYLNVIDAPYINLFNHEEHLAFNNLKEMIVYLETAIVIFLGGCFTLRDIRYIFFVGGLFIIFQIAFAFKALYYKEKEQ